MRNASNINIGLIINRISYGKFDYYKADEETKIEKKELFVNLSGHIVQHSENTTFNFNEKVNEDANIYSGNKVIFKTKFDKKKPSKVKIDKLISLNHK